MRTFSTKVARLLAVSTLTAAALGATTAAHAEHSAKPGPHTTAATKPHTTLRTSCPRDGHLDYNAVCTTLSNGALFHDKGGYGTAAVIHSRYEKRSGSRVTAKLGYSYKGSERWGGWHDYSAGQSREETDTRYDDFNLCAPTIGLLKVDGQGTFQTPATAPTSSC
ncbi:hypothetical protein I5Q34_05525 [Streptomyces sp. AV19]|uniref:hypothetical protein n=1 Tax=Streptomyces sp. AV19 TaxID=2793068 RepID=UPI0018FE35BE|nr:hypothetical protein [Streptomyces sp. AV19]MBH1933760.1 hypothetical protein [Streptomyces sp. AV19]MDG4535736.1 hypothetical protein [Streptomyces sp. AV19]